MLDSRKVGARSALLKAITASDAVLKLQPGMGAAFGVRPGDHTYLTIRSGDQMERVKVQGSTGDMLMVIRGVDDTAPQSWPQGTCISIEWNPAMLCEFIKQCMNGAPNPTGVNPGTYCLSSCTCLTIDGGGRITEIKG